MPKGKPEFLSGDQRLYFGSLDKKFYALDLNGNKIWEYLTLDGIYTTPAISRDGTIYFGSKDGHLYALNPDGTKKWSYNSGGEIHSDPAIGSDGTIYFGADNKKELTTCLIGSSPAGVTIFSSDSQKK